MGEWQRETNICTQHTHSLFALNGNCFIAYKKCFAYVFYSFFSCFLWLIFRSKNRLILINPRGFLVCAHFYSLHFVCTQFFLLVPLSRSSERICKSSSVDSSYRWREWERRRKKEGTSFLNGTTQYICLHVAKKKKLIWISEASQLLLGRFDFIERINLINISMQIALYINNDSITLAWKWVLHLIRLATLNCCS